MSQLLLSLLCSTGVAECCSCDKLQWHSIYNEQGYLLEYSETAVTDLQSRHCSCGKLGCGLTCALPGKEDYADARVTHFPTGAGTSFWVLWLLAKGLHKRIVTAQASASYLWFPAPTGLVSVGPPVLTHTSCHARVMAKLRLVELWSVLLLRSVSQCWWWLLMQTIPICFSLCTPSVSGGSPDSASCLGSCYWNLQGHSV